MSKARNIGVIPDDEQKDGVSAAAEAAEVNAENVPDDEVSAGAAENVGGGTAENPPVLVYIGPSIFRTELISGRAFITHGKKMDDIIPDTLKKYPLARMMFATPEELPAIRAKIHDPGTAVGNAYKKLSGN